MSSAVEAEITREVTNAKTRTRLQSKRMDRTVTGDVGEKSRKDILQSWQPPTADTTPFKKWDPSTFNWEHFMALIYGCSGSGKSFLMKEMISIICKTKIYKEFLLISPTERVSFSFNCFSKKQIWDEFNEEKLFELVESKREKKMNNMKDKPLLIIVDDCAADPRIRSSPALNKIFISGRHFNIGCAVLLQNINPKDGVPPALRNNATMVAITKPRKSKDRQFLVSEWLSLVSDFEGSLAIQSITRGDYQFAIADLHMYANAVKLQDFIFTYKANKIKDTFKVPGGANLKRKRNKVMDDDSDEEEKKVDGCNDKNNLERYNKPVKVIKSADVRLLKKFKVDIY